MAITVQRLFAASRIVVGTRRGPTAIMVAGHREQPATRYQIGDDSAAARWAACSTAHASQGRVYAEPRPLRRRGIGKMATRARSRSAHVGTLVSLEDSRRAQRRSVPT